MAKLLSRCCPSGYSCGVLSNTLVGCCPSGTVCSGFTGQVTTMTLNNNAVQTTFPFIGINTQKTGTVTNAGGGVFIATQSSQGGSNGVVTGNGVFIDPLSSTFTLPAGFVACSTMVMKGDFLPTTRQA